MSSQSLEDLEQFPFRAVDTYIGLQRYVRDLETEVRRLENVNRELKQTIRNQGPQLKPYGHDRQRDNDFGIGGLKPGKP